MSYQELIINGHHDVLDYTRHFPASWDVTVLTQTESVAKVFRSFVVHKPGKDIKCSFSRIREVFIVGPKEFSTREAFTEYLVSM